MKLEFSFPDLLFLGFKKLRWRGKGVKTLMSKLRDVYKGEADHIVEFGGQQVNLKDMQQTDLVAPTD